MNKFIIIGIIISIIIGIVLSSTFLIGITMEGTGSTPGTQEGNEESVPRGRNLSIEFDEKMGFSAP
jgi:hypothetical protein